MINIHKQHKYATLLVLNGNLPSFFKALCVCSPLIVAADGAALKLAALGIVPDYIVGDGDSASHLLPEFQGRYQFHEDQNLTDAEKSLLFIKKQLSFPVLVVGIGGGELDHQLANLQLLLKYAHLGPLWALDEGVSFPENNRITKKIFPLLQGKYQIATSSQSTVSFISFEPVVITTKGLVWELVNTKLSYNTILGVRNKTYKDFFEVQIQEGSCLCIIE